MNPELAEVLTKMCEAVGADIKDVDFRKTNWYWQYEWTMEQQDDFKEWLIAKLKSSAKLRKSIMSVPSRRKKDLDGFASFFLMNYGWKIKKGLSHEQ